MAQATYTTDLQTVSLIESGQSFFEFSGYALGDGAAVETDWYLQGSASASDEANNKTGVGHSIGVDYGSNITFATDECFFAWMQCQAPNAMDTFANGGYRVLMGSSSTVFYGWYVGGSDFGRNPYGGWTNVAVDPTATAQDTGHGSPTTWRYFGVAFKLVSAIGKGRPINADAYRYGRGDMIFQFGDLGNGYATFDGGATANDGTNAKWGLLQKQGATSYLWKGLLSFGTATNAVDFRDSSKSITIDDTPRTYAGFNKIEIVNSGSRVDWTGVSFSASNPDQLSAGSFEMIDNANVNLLACSFIDMTTFIFQSNATVSSTFTRCGQITHAGADFSGSVVSGADVTANTSAVLYNVATDPDGEMDGMYFEMGANSSHAIEFGTSVPSSMTIRDCDFVGYGAGNNANDSTFHFKDTAGTITLNIVGGSGNVSYRTDGATILIVQDPVTTTVHAVLTDGTDIQSARVLLRASDGTGDLPYNDVVSITSSSGTATVSHTAHGLASNQYVVINGATPEEYNKVAQITVTGVNAYTYTVASGISSPAGGSPVSTGALVYGLTDVNGEVSDTRTLSVNQPVVGWVRKSTTQPYYKSSPITGEVDSSGGLTLTALMISDE